MCYIIPFRWDCTQYWKYNVIPIITLAELNMLKSSAVKMWFYNYMKQCLQDTQCAVT